MAFLYYKKLNIGCLYLHTTTNLKDIINNGKNNEIKSDNLSYITYIISKLKTYLPLYNCNNCHHNIKNNIFYIYIPYFELIYNCILPFLIESLENENQNNIKIINDLFDIYLYIYNNISMTNNYEKKNRAYLQQFFNYSKYNNHLEKHYKELLLFLLNIDNIYNIKHNNEYVNIKENYYNSINYNQCNIL